MEKVTKEEKERYERLKELKAEDEAMQSRRRKVCVVLMGIAVVLMILQAIFKIFIAHLLPVLVKDVILSLFALTIVVMAMGVFAVAGKKYDNKEM
jgi:uncharacterized protein YqhQ